MSVTIDDHVKSIMKAPVSIGIYDPCCVSKLHVTKNEQAQVLVTSVGTEDGNLHTIIARKSEDRRLVRPGFFELSFCNALAENLELGNAFLQVLGFGVRLERHPKEIDKILAICSHKPWLLTMEGTARKEVPHSEVLILDPRRVHKMDVGNLSVVRYARFMGRGSKRWIFWSEPGEPEKCVRLY